MGILKNFYKKSKPIVEHPLILDFDDVVYSFNQRLEYFNNCPPDQIDEVIALLKISEEQLNQIIRKAKKEGIKSVAIRSRLLLPLPLSSVLNKNKEAI